MFEANRIFEFVNLTRAREAPTLHLVPIYVLPGRYEDGVADKVLID
jgi:hypothetical protein